jgi:hypothetical protein
MTVTARRYIPRKISLSRNADDCQWCSERFKPRQMRYPVMTCVGNSVWGGWGIASVCMKCFKDGHDCPSTLHDSIFNNDRVNYKCAGCGEPIQTIVGTSRGQWHVCSNRCYQRNYRKRRRGRQSVVDWKAESHAPRCEACKRSIDSSRCDARFCSNRCRQWHYRRRKRAGAA